MWLLQTRMYLRKLQYCVYHLTSEFYRPSRSHQLLMLMLRIGEIFGNMDNLEKITEPYDPKSPLEKKYEKTKIGNLIPISKGSD